jgi:hypothetical protein
MIGAVVEGSTATIASNIAKLPRLLARLQTRGVGTLTGW